jgi:hypothetical protein
LAHQRAAGAGVWLSRIAPLGPPGRVPRLHLYYKTLRLPIAHLAALRFLRLAQFNLVDSYRVTFDSGCLTTIDDLLTNDGDVLFSNFGAIDATLNVSDDVILESNLTLAQFFTMGDVNLNIADLLLVGGGSSFSVDDGAAVTLTTKICLPGKAALETHRLYT